VSKVPVVLDPARAGPYLRALSWGLHALAPHDDHVPMAAARRHLASLDPALTGELLGPAEVDPASGLPAYPWLERARAEVAALRAGGQVHSEASLERARQLDAALGARLGWREALRNHVRGGAMLSSSALTAHLVRLEPRRSFRLVYDRLVAGAGWMRLRVDLTGPQGWQGTELFGLQADDSVATTPGLHHLFARHCLTPLTALHPQLAQATGAVPTRISRGFIGPFWFPGGPMPAELPDWARGALALHLHLTVLGRDVHHSHHADPWVPPVVGERLPSGHGLYRERRFAVSPARVGHAAAWSRARGSDVVVVPLRPLA